MPNKVSKKSLPKIPDRLEAISNPFTNLKTSKKLHLLKKELLKKIDTFPPLDFEQTLVIIFEASEFFDVPGPIRELGSAYPRSHLVGCFS